MGAPEIIALITAALQFPNEILQFIDLLKKTPQQNHEDILKAIAEQAKQFEDTGRAAS